MNLFTEEMRRDPYPLYAQLRASSPVHFAPGDMWIVLGHDDVRRVLTDHESFSSNAAPTRGVTFEWLLFMDPPRHTALRAIVSRAFTPRMVAGLEPRIRAISRGLLDAVAAHGELDLVADYAAPLPMMVIAEMVGMPVEDWPALRSWSDAIIGLGNTIMGTPEAAQAASAAFYAAEEQMRTYIAALVARRREAPRDDLITRLIEAEVDGRRLADHEVLRFVQLLIAAGTETTTNLIGNGMLTLLERPELRAPVAADPTRFIEEVLRHRTPVQAMFRATAREVELSGKIIPAGKFVMAMIGSANRDPRVFANPDSFDVARDPNPHVAFGHGIHFCLGAPLSRLEARVAFPDLVARLLDVRRAGDDPWPPRSSFHVHGPSRLPLEFKAAGPSKAG